MVMQSKVEVNLKNDHKDIMRIYPPYSMGKYT